MKKLLLFVLSAAFAQNLFSQISKGNLLIGGNAGISSEKVPSPGPDAPEYKNTTVIFLPNAGYFIFNKTAAGLRLGVSSVKSDPGSSGPVITVTDFSLSPFVRYYFLKEKNKVNIFTDLSYNHASSKTKYYDYSLTTNKNGFTVSAGPSVFLNSYVAMEFTFGYVHSKIKESDIKDNTFQTSVGFQIHLGKIKK